MKLPLRRFPIRLVCAAALLAGWLGAADAVRADCGDYVMIGHPPTARTDAANPLAPDLADHGPPPPTEHRRPCQGPHCQRAPAMPPAAPVSVEGQRLTEWPCHLALSPATGRDGAEILEIPSCPLPVRRARAVYHPPRLPDVRG